MTQPQQTAPTIVFPTISANDPRFVWNPHGDVQTTWRRFGWVPLAERQQQNPDKKQGALQTSQL